MRLFVWQSRHFADVGCRISGLMKKTDQLNQLAERLPRVAIVGGGGAMGRLFATLLQPAVRELYLFDLFGTGPTAANVPHVLDDLRKSAARAGLSSSQFGIKQVDGDPSQLVGTEWSIEPFGPESNRAILVLDRESVTSGDGNPSGQFASLGGLVDSTIEAHSRGGVVFAGLPTDAANLLARADVILLAIGFESEAAYARAMTSYLPWLRSGSLVVELGSTKIGPMSVLRRDAPFDVGVLGAHPLFGPTVTDVTGLIVAVVDARDGRTESPWRAWFLEALAHLRMIVTSTTAENHDDAMAFVQGLTHFALLSFAYTFVRVDRDPADLLLYRTPVFEPLLYLAARVAHLARSNPDTYRSIQALTVRPDVRREFLSAARELLDAIEQVSDPSTGSRDGFPDPLTSIFRKFGAPWSPDGRDRRESQRREHFLEMGVHLVDNLNKLRQEIVSSVGLVRAIEERRAGLPPRIIVGIVAVDLLNPGKYDLATQIRLRRLNLPLGSVRGAPREANRPLTDSAQDDIVPLSRARILTDSELLEWLFQTKQLVEQRRFRMLVPQWFDPQVLDRLIKGVSAGSQVWHVDLIDDAPSGPVLVGKKLATVIATIVVHPGELVAIRAGLEFADDQTTVATLDQIDSQLALVRTQLDESLGIWDRSTLDSRKDRLKHERKSLLDRRTREIDREVRRVTRRRVQEIGDAALTWLASHGCAIAPWVSPPSGIDQALDFGNTEPKEDSH